MRAISPKFVTPSKFKQGAIFVHHRPGVRVFFEEWLAVFRQRFDLIDDTPSVVPNDEAFVAHRHDQSVFSLLAKIRGVTLLSALEQYPAGSPPDWKLLRDFPIHHRRDKRKLSRKIGARVRELARPAEALLVRLKKSVVSRLRISQ